MLQSVSRPVSLTIIFTEPIFPGDREKPTYSGLFAEQGDFDIPSTAVLGVAFTPRADPRWTVAAEYQRIFYGEIDAIANSGAVITPNLGADDGLVGQNDELSTITLGWNHYVHGHAAKFTVDLNWVLDGGTTR